MIRTVDLVVVGDGGAARAAAADALQRSLRVLVVLRSSDPRVGRRLRRCLRKSAGADAGQLTVLTSADVVCADGVDRVEAVVIRHARTGRLSAVNASAFVSWNGSKSAHARGTIVAVAANADSGDACVPVNTRVRSLRNCANRL